MIIGVDNGYDVYKYETEGFVLCPNLLAQDAAPVDSIRYTRMEDGSYELHRPRTRDSGEYSLSPFQQNYEVKDEQSVRTRCLTDLVGRADLRSELYLCEKKDSGWKQIEVLDLELDYE